MVDVKGEVMLEKELEDILRKNPWQPLANALRNALSKGQSWKSIPMYAKDDEKHVARFNDQLQQKRGRRILTAKYVENHKLNTECPPLPYVGTPTARVWLLLMNPGYSPLDYYNFVDRDSGRDMIRDSQGQEKALQEAWLNENDSPDLFCQRQNLYVNSLDFNNSPGHEFYVLDKCMDTVRKQGSSLHGGYNWYGQKLFKGWNDRKGNVKDRGAYFHATTAEQRLAVASQHVFDLEYAAYHSINFTSAKDYKDFAHTKFWEKLVGYALRTDKILIVRGDELMELVRQVDENAFKTAIAHNRILTFVSGQNVAVSRSNLAIPDEYGTSALGQYCATLNL